MRQTQWTADCQSRSSPSFSPRVSTAADRLFFKCNGLKPCNTCTRRNLICTYTANSQDHGLAPSPKRQHIEPPSGSAGAASTTEVPPIVVWDQIKHTAVKSNVEMQSIGAVTIPGGNPLGLDTRTPVVEGGSQEVDFDRKSGTSGASCPDEEAAVYSQPRMLQDSTGRLCELLNHTQVRPRQLLGFSADYKCSIHWGLCCPLLSAADPHDRGKCFRAVKIHNGPAAASYYGKHHKPALQHQASAPAPRRPNGRNSGRVLLHECMPET